MINPISQSTIKCPVFKKADNKTQYNVVGQKAAESISNDLDFQKKIVEQNERLITINGLFALTFLFGTFLFNLKTLNEIFRKKANRHMPANLRNFISLKDDNKVPALENCKSINQNLKNILQRQINNLKAGSDVMSETGEPQASNRLLLYGPAGVGKSFFAKIFAKSIDAEYMEVMFSDFNSMWVGEDVNNLKKVFEEIIKTAEKNPNKKYVVTFNEIDSSLASNNEIVNSKGTHWVSILEQRSVFLNYLETLKTKVPNVTIIGTTNLSPRNNGLDKAALSRFQNLIEVPYPDKECLYEALKMNLDNIKNKEKFFTENEKSLKELAQKMADRQFSFRNLEYIINDAKEYHLDDNVNGKKGGFKFEYLEKAENNLKFSDGELDKKQV